MEPEVGGEEGAALRPGPRLPLASPQLPLDAFAEWNPKVI